jgi:hypothetical protein
MTANKPISHQPAKQYGTGASPSIDESVADQTSNIAERDAFLPIDEPRGYSLKPSRFILKLQE